MTRSEELLNNIVHTHNIVTHDPLGKCYHYTLYFEIMTQKQNQNNLNEKYDCDKLSCEFFMNTMEAESWDEIFSENTNFNVAYDKFIRVVNKAIHASTPVMNSFRRNKAPWATRRISKLAAKKRRKWHVYKNRHCCSKIMMLLNRILTGFPKLKTTQY